MNSSYRARHHHARRFKVTRFVGGLFERLQRGTLRVGKHLRLFLTTPLNSARIRSGKLSK